MCANNANQGENGVGANNIHQKGEKRDRGAIQDIFENP